MIKSQCLSLLFLTAPSESVSVRPTWSHRVSSPSHPPSPLPPFLTQLAALRRFIACNAAAMCKAVKKYLKYVAVPYEERDAPPSPAPSVTLLEAVRRPK